MKIRQHSLKLFSLGMVLLFSGLFVQAANITSTGSGNWSASAWPNTTRTGTISVANGSTSVVGNGTLFTTQISVGNIIKTTGNVVIGTVASISDNTHLTLLLGAPAVRSAISFNVQGVGSGDNVSIANNNSVTVDINANCLSLTIVTGNSPSTLTISGSNSLTVSGAVTINAGTGSGDNKIIAVGAGSFNCNSISVAATGSTSRSSGVTLSTGTVSVTGNITMTDTNEDFTFSDAGTLNVGGNMSGGTFTASTGTVNYNGDGTGGTSSNQTIGAYAYYNITTSGNGTKTLVAATPTVSGALTVKAGTTLALLTYPLGATTAPTSIIMEIGTTGSVISGTGTGVLHLGGNVAVNYITGSSGATISCPISLDGTRTFTVADDGSSATDLSISGVMSLGTGTGWGITKGGTGTLSLSGLNTYTGATLINAGTLELGIGSALTASGPLGTGAGGTTVSPGAVLDLNGFSLTGTYTEAITLNGTGLAESPAGALTNTGANASIVCPITLGSASTITATSSGTLTCSGTVGTGAFALTLDGASATNGTMSGVISAPTSVIKNGAGTWILMGANTYTGITTITSGELRLNPAANVTPATQFVMNGGALSTTGITATRTITSSSTLQLNSSSSLALGTNAHSLSFSASNGVSWSAGTLTISGWTGGYDGTSGTAGKIFVGSNSSGLTTAQLSQIQFFNGSTNFPATILSTGEVVPYVRIMTQTITGSPFCAGTSGVSVPFTYDPKANFAGATFTAQLSNASGSFTSPVNLQSVASNGTGSQSLNVTIPPATTAGTGYRIRIVSTNPAITGSDNGTDITVSAAVPAQPGAITGSAAPCANAIGVTYSVPNVSGVVYTWALPAGWTQTGGGTTNSITVTTGSASGNVLVTPSNACGAGTAQTLSVSVVAVPAITVQPSTNPQSLCQNGTTTALSVTATGTGLSYQWYNNTSNSNSGGTLLSGATSSSYTPPSLITGTLYYYCVVSGTCAPSATSGVSGPVTIVVPQALVGKPGSSCVTSTVNLSVTTSACYSPTIGWFAAATGGTSLGAGTSFTTPSISTTKTYYAQETFTGGLAASTSNPLATNLFGLAFNLNEPIVLNSVQINASGTASSTTIGLQDNTGTAVTGITPVTFTPTVGTQTVNLNWTIPSGSGYRIVKTAGTMNLSTTTSSLTWPVGFEVGSITGSIESGAVNTSRYDYFYNWSISRKRVPVTATIGAPTVTGFNGSSCGPGIVTLGASATGGTISWFTTLTGGSAVATGTVYSPNLSTTTTYYVQSTDGACTSAPRTPVVASIITKPTIAAGGAGTYCTGSTVNLTSSGSGLTNVYWTGPNGFYSLVNNPVLTGVTSAMTGTYTVIGSALSGVNLITNGNFESGNTGFGSSYIDSSNCQPEGTYAVVANPNSVHPSWTACVDHTSGTGLQLVVNGATVPNVNIWSQTVNVVPNTDYQYTYWIQSVYAGNPSQLQLYINGSPAGPIYTADLAACSWRQFTYNWNSGSSTSAYLSLVNQNTIANGNDFALDDIVFQPACTTESSVPLYPDPNGPGDEYASFGVIYVTVSADPTAGAIGSTQSICSGATPSTLTSITSGTGSGTITYEWQANSATITGATSATYSPPSLTVTTSYQRRTVTTNKGTVCYSSYTTPVTITVNSAATATAGGPDFGICQSASPSPITLSGASVGGGATTGAWSIVSGGGSLSTYSQTATPATVTYTPSANYSGIVTLQLTTNNVGCSAIADRTITIDPITTINNQSTASQTQCINGTFALITVTVTGAGLSYQWYSNSTASTSGGISLGSANGAQANSYTPQAGTAGTLYYYCIVNGNCGTATSAISGAFLVNPVTSIGSQSTGAQTQCNGGTFSSISVSATGVGLSYQWYKNSTPSTSGGTSLGSGNGAQTNSYTPQTTSVGTLYYYCIVSGTCGTVTSAVSGAFLVNPNTSIGSQSTGAQTQCNGGTFTTISVTASGVGLSYQWYKNTTSSISGGTSLGSGNGAQTNSYIPQTTSVGTLYYYCIVNGTCGTVTSTVSGAFLVNPNTSIGSQSTGTQTQCNGGTFTPISVTASGVGLSYQWYKNTTSSTSGGTSLGSGNGAQTNSYTPQTTSVGTLYYYCIVSGTCGTITSAVSGAFLVNPNTSIGSQSTGAQTQCNGGTFTPISVTASGVGLTYQWYSNTTSSTSGGTSLGSGNGAQTNSYTPQTTIVGSLYYYCIVNGTCGTITSTVSGAFVVNPNLPVSISIAPSANPVCSGTSVSYTAIPTNGGASPAYQWNVNGINVGTNSNTYSYVPANGDVITCVLTSNATCITGNPATSNVVTSLVNATGTWLGITSTDWNTASNWCGGIPTSTTNVIIPPGGNQPVISAAAVCNNLTINSSATLTIAGSNTLTVSGNWINNGTFTSNSSTVNFNSSGSSNISVSNFNNITISGVGTINATGTIMASGNFNLTSGQFVLNNSTSNNINISGNYTQTGGAFDFNAGTSGASTMLIGGNMSHTSGAGSMTTSGAGAPNGVIIFNGSVIQTMSITIPGGAIWVKYSVPSGKSVQMLSNITLSSADGASQAVFQGEIIVNGTLDLGTSIISQNNGVAGTAVFTANSGATLITANTGGIDGSIASTNMTRTFDNGANWVLNGAASQITSVGMPATMNNLTIINNAGVSLTNPSTINGTLTLTTGAFSIGPNTITFQNSNTPIIRTSGTITTASGTNLVFGTAGNTGGNAFVIPSGTFTSAPVINNLTINRVNSITLNDQVMSVQGILLCNGPLNSNNNLTLLSTSTQTALIDGTGTGDVTGIVTMQRYLASGFGYKYFSSPFQGATVGQFSSYVNLSASFPTFYRYDESSISSGWVNYTNTSGNLVPLNGYAANLGANPSPITVSISGVVNNKTQSPITLSNHNQTYTLGYNLVGNPYPSPIDWDASSGWTKTNIDNAIYFFNASGDGGNSGANDSLQYQGTYSSYVRGISTGSANNIIPSMQGFFVHVTDGTYPVSGSLGVTNPVRINDFTTSFKSATIDNQPILRVSANFDGGPADPALIYFDDMATPLFDKNLDALKMMNTDTRVPNLYSISQDSRKLSIDGLPFLTDSLTRIPLGIKISQRGVINFHIEDLTNISTDTHVYFEDAANRTCQDVKNNPDYHVALNVGTYENRFSIIFAMEGLTTPPPIVYADKFTLIPAGGVWMINIEQTDNIRGILQLVNIQGQVLYRKEVFGNESVELKNPPSSGVYIISLISENKIYSKKIVMQKR